MSNLPQNQDLSKPQTYKIPTPFGPFRIVVDVDDSRWIPIATLGESIGVTTGALLAKLGNNRYWGTKNLDVPQAAWKLCISARRVTDFLKTIKEKQVPSLEWNRFRWLQAHAYTAIHGFQVPAPVVPLITPEPEVKHDVIRTPRPKVQEPEAAPMAVVSSELIPIQRAQLGESEVNAVSGRDLHAFLEVGKEFANWIKDQIEAFGFVDGSDFEVIAESGKNPLGGRPTKEYMISISMAKELAMVQRTAKGKQARLYFIECERRAMAPIAPVSQFRVPTNLREALHLAAELEDKRMELASKVESQQATIAILEPEANGLDLIATKAEGSHTLTESAKILQQPPRKFVKFLEMKQWIYRTNGNLTAYQERIHQGYMEHEFCVVQHGDGPALNVAQPLITPKGLARLAQILGVVAA